MQEDVIVSIDKVEFVSTVISKWAQLQALKMYNLVGWKRKKKMDYAMQLYVWVSWLNLSYTKYINVLKLACAVI